MTKIQITLPENVMDAIRAEAAMCSVTPAIISRIRLCMLFPGKGTWEIKKSYVVSLENWQEAEAYVKVKHPGSTFADFAIKAAIAEMRRCPLKPAQKADFEKLLGK